MSAAEHANKLPQRLVIRLPARERHLERRVNRRPPPRPRATDHHELGQASEIGGHSARRPSRLFWANASISRLAGPIGTALVPDRRTPLPANLRLAVLAGGQQHPQRVVRWAVDDRVSNRSVVTGAPRKKSAFGAS